MTQGFFFSEINLLLCAYRNHLCFLKKTCMFIIAMLKNSFLVKKALGEMFDRNFHGGGGNKFVLIFNSTICGGPFLCLCEVKV